MVVGKDGLVTADPDQLQRALLGPALPLPERAPASSRRSTTSTADDVTETVTLRDRLSGGGRSRQTATVTAQRTVDADGAESWSGTFKTRVVLTRGGKRLDKCELKRVTWTATPTS